MKKPRRSTAVACSAWFAERPSPPMTAPQETLKLAATPVGQSLGAAPLSAICGNCNLYEPHRDSQTGRVHPSKEGRCGWKPNIKWSMAYRRNGFGWPDQDPIVYPVGVWKNTDAKTCACFSPNGNRHSQL